MREPQQQQCISKTASDLATRFLPQTAHPFFFFLFFFILEQLEEREREREKYRRGKRRGRNTGRSTRTHKTLAIHLQSETMTLMSCYFSWLLLHCTSIEPRRTRVERGQNVSSVYQPVVVITEKKYNTVVERSADVFTFAQIKAPGGH